MTFLSRIVTLALVAGAALMPMTDGAFAQGATVGPAGGLPSTTAPSNSQGTPAGGTGVISTTRVGPSGAMQAAPESMGTPTRSSHRRRHHYRRTHRRATTTTVAPAQ